MTGKKYTVAVDFDGVLHSYITPWVSADVIPDPPVEGAIEWLNEISKDFVVVIHTTRGATLAGRIAVRKYLEEHGFKEGHIVEVTNVKQPALVYVDDRAWRFEGRFPDRQEIHNARPWNKQKKNKDG